MVCGEHARGASRAAHLFASVPLDSHQGRAHEQRAAISPIASLAAIVFVFVIAQPLFQNLAARLGLGHPLTAWIGN